MTNEQALAHYRGVLKEAAEPDMLEALRDLLYEATAMRRQLADARMPTSYAQQEAITYAEAVIAKATAADKLREGM